MKALLTLLMLAVPVQALSQDCPAARDRSADTDALLRQIRAAGDEVTARQLTDKLWRIWTDAPDTTAQELLDRGMERREAYDYAAALQALDALVEYCPDYAEGYNQRAFVNFLRQDYATALEDLEVALDLSPHHVAAMSGLALTLMSLGRVEAGQAILRRAIDLHPWLPERRMLIRPPGQDL